MKGLKLAAELKKLYYSIGEVSEIAQLKPYVLRYWEGEFPILAPAKNRAGNRIYTEKDISKILEIKRLLYQDKFTIEGARQYFKNNQGSVRKAEPTTKTTQVHAGMVIEKDKARKALLEIQEAVSDLIQIIHKER